MTPMTEAAVVARLQQPLTIHREGDAVKPSIFRTVVAGIAGSIVFSLGTFVTFALIGSGLNQHVFFEFLGPFNLLGEPPALVGLELVFWAAAAIAEAAAIVAILEARQWIAHE